MILDFLSLHIVVEMTAKESILALLSLRHDKNRVISAENQSVMDRYISEFTVAYFPRDKIPKRNYFEVEFKISLGSKSEWGISSSCSTLVGAQCNGIQMTLDIRHLTASISKKANCLIK